MTDTSSKDIGSAIDQIIRSAASSKEAINQADKNEIGEYLVLMSKAIESLWTLMDEDLLFLPAAAQLLAGIQNSAGSVRLMLVGAILERDPGALHMAAETHRRERERA